MNSSSRPEPARKVGAWRVLALLRPVARQEHVHSQTREGVDIAATSAAWRSPGSDRAGRRADAAGARCLGRGDEEDRDALQLDFDRQALESGFKIGRRAQDRFSREHGMACLLRNGSGGRGRRSGYFTRCSEI